MGMLKEFKEFALKGNMIDMAVGIVIGAAFSSVINSLVKDVITPPLGLLTEKAAFQTMVWNLRAADEAKGVQAVNIDIGSFINALISFLIVAAAIFTVVKAMNRLRHQFEASDETPAPSTKKCPACKMEVPIDATKCGHCTSSLVV